MATPDTHRSTTTCTDYSPESSISFPSVCSSWLEPLCYHSTRSAIITPQTFCQSPFVLSTSTPIRSGDPNFSLCVSRCSNAFPNTASHTITGCVPCFCAPGQTAIALSSTTASCRACPSLPVQSGLSGCLCSSFGANFVAATSALDGPCACVSGYTLTCTQVYGTFQPTSTSTAAPLCQCVVNTPPAPTPTPIPFPSPTPNPTPDPNNNNNNPVQTPSTSSSVSGGGLNTAALVRLQLFLVQH